MKQSRVDINGVPTVDSRLFDSDFVMERECKQLELPKEKGRELLRSVHDSE